jgi:hypothetical protein
MIVFYIILAASPVLLLGAVAFFVLIVAGVRKGDRSHLANAPRSGSDALARRLLVGVRHPGGTEDQDGQR